MLLYLVDGGDHAFLVVHVVLEYHFIDQWLLHFSEVALNHSRDPHWQMWGRDHILELGQVLNRHGLLRLNIALQVLLVKLSEQVFVEANDGFRECLMRCLAPDFWAARTDRHAECSIAEICVTGLWSSTSVHARWYIQEGRSIFVEAFVFVVEYLDNNHA